MMELGVAVLLMMLEKMLSGEGKISPEQINIFLQQLLKERYGLSVNSTEINELRTYLVDGKLRNGGEKFLSRYTDLATGEEKIYAFDLITYDSFSYKDLKEKNLYLKLTQEGIELLFKTKELFAEMQISITMLYFKQQLSKGMFLQALSAAEELKLQIQSEIQAIEKYENDIRTNALTMFKRDELEKKYEESYKQTKEDKRQLSDLRITIEEVKTNYIAGQLSRKEREAYGQVLRIEKVLTLCIAKHELLFVQKFNLLKTLTSSLQLLIGNAFSKNFNFKQEILESWVERRIDQLKVEAVLRPVMPQKVNKFYNPFAAFDRQYTKKQHYENEQMEDAVDNLKLEIHREELEQQKEAVYNKEMKALEFILEPLQNRNRYFLSDIVNEANGKEPENSCLEANQLHHLLNISIKLHRSEYKSFGPIPLEELPFESDEIRMMVALGKKHPGLKEISSFEIFATDRVLTFVNGVVMTDYVIERMKLEHEL
ncbi:hypothetical protein QMA09_07620 [Planococcus sp. APC 3906]|uniref:hypothetical protein n=1 Tax=Planococcus sp. APC 3906 TaxID=3035194 RepID=UPI0025B40F19|nr:hypothetical protein [Planococcus sp. APC 3906]MDN3450055.1 hypothetical protein [Planococcus sp. APC 3906]